MNLTSYMYIQVKYKLKSGRSSHFVASYSYRSYVCSKAKNRESDRQVHTLEQREQAKSAALPT
jgi:hypothetical protein